MAVPELTLAGAMRLHHGKLAAEDAAFGGRQFRLTTAVLLVDRASPVPVRRLTEALWPLGPPAQFRPALRGLVSKVRRLLADVGIQGDRIHSRQGRYVVELPELRVDLEQAAATLEQAREGLAGGDVEASRARASAVRAVLSRPILPGVEAGWVDQVRNSSHEQLLESMLILGTCRLELGDLSGARGVIRRAVETAPFREDAWRLAMRIEQRAGNTAAALDLYEELRQGLVEELGVGPSTSTRRLHATLLREPHAPPPRPIPRPSPSDVDSATGPAVSNPYVGLRPFDTGDADRFFGRETSVQSLLDRVGAHRGVAVVGPSGVGKSSLVRAGLLPALAAGGLPDSDLWQPLVVTPGADPVAGLAVRLASVTRSWQGDPEVLAGAIAEDHDALGELLAVRDGTRSITTLVVVDQAEELFTLATPRQADQFVSALLRALTGPRSGLRLVVTMRADFYQRASQHAGLADFLSRSQFVVSPLRGDGLQAAITEPARRASVRLQEGVLGRLVGEAGTGASALPLLQHALWRLWRQSDTDVLTLAALDSMGGVAGALAEHAETTWNQLSSRQRRIARALLLRGVVPTVAGASATPVARSDLRALGPSEELDTVIAGLVDARLITTWRQTGTGRSMLQLSHEALVDAWPRLAAWVDAQRIHLQVAARLATASDQWTAQRRHDDWLLTGRRLDDARDLADVIDQGTVDAVLSTTEASLIEASERARAVRRQRAAARRDHERHLQEQAFRHLRVGLALSGANDALDHDPERTLLLCLAVAQDIATHVPEHRPAWLRLLHHGLANHLLVGRLPDVGPLLAVLPDGRLVTACTATSKDPQVMSGRVELRDRINGDLLGALTSLEPARPTVVAVDATGTHVAAGATDGRIHVVSATLERVHVIEGPDSVVGSVALSPGGELVAGLWFRDDTRCLRVHDTATGRLVHESEPIAHPHASERFPHGHQLDFHPSESRLLVTTGPRHSVLRLLDTTTWAPLVEHDLGTSIRHAQHSPSGDHVGTSHFFGVSIHDATTLTRRHSTRLAEKLPTATWNEDGSALVAAGTSLHHLTLDGERPRSRPPRTRRKPALGEWVEDRVLLTVPRARELVTGRRDSPGVLRWDVGGDVGAEVVRLPGTSPLAAAVAWSPDGRRLVQADKGSVVLWDVDGWSERARRVVTDQPAPGGDTLPNVENVAWTPDGRSVIAPASGGRLVVVHGETGAIEHVHERTPAFFPGDVDVTSDGDWIAATHGDSIHILDHEYQLADSLDSPHGSSVEAVAFSPGGRWLATTHWPTATDIPGAQGATVWDWRTRRVVGFRSGVANNVCWAPGGRTLAVSMEGRTIVWDVERDVVVHELVGHRGWVQDVTYSPDGSTIATAGWDGDLRLWDAETGIQHLHLTGHNCIHRLQYHPSRPWLALGTVGGHAHVWTLDTDELLDIARDRVTRDLRPDERDRFLPKTVEVATNAPRAPQAATHTP